MLTLAAVLAGLVLGRGFIAVLCWLRRPAEQPTPLGAPAPGPDRYAAFNAGPLDVRPPVGTVIHLYRDHTTTGD